MNANQLLKKRIGRPKAISQYSVSDHEKWQELIDAGKSIRQVAEMEGCGISTVTKYTTPRVIPSNEIGIGELINRIQSNEPITEELVITKDKVMQFKIVPIEVTK